MTHKLPYPVVFVDADGVVCLDGTAFDPDCMQRLSRLTRATGSRCVISASRRGDPNALHAMFHAFDDHRVPMVGITSDLPIADDCYNDRIDEILDWVRRRNPTNWVVLDDLLLLDLIIPERQQISQADFSRHFVRVEPFDGLQDRHVEDAVRLLQTPPV